MMCYCNTAQGYSLYFGKGTAASDIFKITKYNKEIVN